VSGASPRSFGDSSRQRAAERELRRHPPPPYWRRRWPRPEPGGNAIAELVERGRRAAERREQMASEAMTFGSPDRAVQAETIVPAA
jgi:hypothetical protein